jgi:type IV pilus assembly protein PilF
MRFKAIASLAAAALLAAGGCARSPASGFLDAGLASARQDAWEEAGRQWAQAVEKDPGSAAAHNNLAVAYERQGAWEAAEREYGEALRLAPDEPTIKANYAAFKARLERLRGRMP